PPGEVSGVSIRGALHHRVGDRSCVVSLDGARRDVDDDGGVPRDRHGKQQRLPLEGLVRGGAAHLVGGGGLPGSAGADEAGDGRAESAYSPRHGPPLIRVLTSPLLASFKLTARGRARELTVTFVGRNTKDLTVTRDLPSDARPDRSRCRCCFQAGSLHSP